MISWPSGYYCSLIKSSARSPITSVEIAPRTYHVKHTLAFRISHVEHWTIRYPADYRISTKRSFVERTRRSVCLSNQRLTTRGRPVTKRYASLIAITRFHVAIKRVYARLFPCTNNNALRGSIVARHLLCEPRTSKRRGGYGALTQNSHDRSFIFFCILFHSDSKIRNKIYKNDLHLIERLWFVPPFCDNYCRDYRESPILTNTLSVSSDFPSDNA